MDHPGVRFPPPGWLLGGFLLGWLLEMRVKRVHFSDSVSVVALLHIVGVLLIVGGLALAV